MNTTETLVAKLDDALEALRTFLSKLDDLVRERPDMFPAELSVREAAELMGRPQWYVRSLLDARVIDYWTVDVANSPKGRTAEERLDRVSFVNYVARHASFGSTQESNDAVPRVANREHESDDGLTLGEYFERNGLALPNQGR